MTGNVINLADRQSPEVRRRACDAVTAQRVARSRHLTLDDVMNDPRACGSAGTVHVMPCEEGGYYVCHESHSGDSWGGMHGPFDRAADAVGMAHRLNVTEYAGDCIIAVCPEARTEIEREAQ